MSTMVVINYCGKPHFKSGSSKGLTEDEVHELVQEGLIGIDPAKAEINVYHEFEYDRWKKL